MSKQLTFVATEAGVDENDDCLIATLDSGADKYIMFQRSPEFGSLDDDGVYVEVNSQIYAAYDSVGSCSATNAQFDLHLTSPLNGFTEIHATLSMPQEDLHEFLDMLRRIFTGRESLLKIDGGC